MEKEVEEKIKVAFEKIDKDGDKTIDFNEFESYLKARDTKGNGLSDKDIQKIF